MTTTSPSPDGRSTRWDQHRATRRRELVEATLRAIRKHGAGVGMDDIAAVAGTSKTVIYRHFSDRQGLYAAVCESVDALILHNLDLATGTGRARTRRARTSHRGRSSPAPSMPTSPSWRRTPRSTGSS